MNNVKKNLESGRLSEGELVRRFEQSLENEFGMRNVVAVNSGTSALHLALILAGVGEGDEVILPAQTFKATGDVIVQCGAKPIFADIEMDGNINSADVAEKMTDKTKAVIAVSWGGNPCDLRHLTYVCQQGEAGFIQDNAQALSATYEGKDLSYWSDFSCYSFQAIKALSTGDGGALSCRYKIDKSEAKKLRWFYIDREKDLPDETGERVYNAKKAGFKYHMNDYSAALGLGNLSGFKDRLERVKKIAEVYRCYIPHVEHIVKKEGCSYWLYDVLVNRRSDFLKAMKDRGIPVSIVHKGIDHNDIFGGKQDLPIQRYWDANHVCLPIHAGLTDEDVEKVIEAVKIGW